MRLQDITALVAHIAQIKMYQTKAGLWEVGIFLQGELSESGIFLKGDLSQEHKVTKFHNRGTPRTWKSLDKAVKTLETALGAKFTELDIPFQKKVNHENATPHGT